MNKSVNDKSLHHRGAQADDAGRTKDQRIKEAKFTNFHYKRFGHNVHTYTSLLAGRQAKKKLDSHKTIVSGDATMKTTLTAM